MIYFTRQEQRIIILLVVAVLIGTGFLLVRRFQPWWIIRLSMGKPDFDVEKDERSPRLKGDGSTSVAGSSRERYSDQSKETDAPASVQQPDQADTPDVTSQLSHPKARVNINTASKKELESLPRIGPVLAQRIIEYRQRHGRFTHIHELTGVSGIGDATLQNIKDLITVEEQDGKE